MHEDHLITNVKSRADVPLSFAQERYWFCHQFEPENSASNWSMNLQWKGSLDVSILWRSLNEIVRRHESLRTCYLFKDDRSVQQALPEYSLQRPIVDLRGLADAEKEAEATHLMSSEAAPAFGLEKGPLCRAQLLRLADDLHWLQVVVDGSVFDAWSKFVLWRELITVYESFAAGEPSSLPELPLQYADYAVWQRQSLQGEILSRKLTYWKQQLTGIPALLDLPVDHPRPPEQAFHGARQEICLGRDLLEGLERLGQQEHASLFTTVLAAFQVLLSRYGNQEDVVVGAQLPGRVRPELRDLIGNFANPVALRTNLSGSPTFRELLRHVRQVVAMAETHQDVPFTKVIDEMHHERNSSHAPIFQVMFALEEAPPTQDICAGLTVTLREEGIVPAQFDLKLSLTAQSDGLRGTIDYDRDLFDAATIARLRGHLLVLLEGIVADPEMKIEELPLLTETERRQVLVEWNQTATDSLRDGCVHQLFEAQVERTPDAVAVTHNDRSLTYRQLNRRANQLAHHLQELGVGPEVRVGVCVDRSLEMLVGLLGVLKAGGAYVPLDPAYPRDRVTFMLQDCRASVLLTQQKLADTLPGHAAQVVLLDADWPRIAGLSNENLPCRACPTNLAYVIYTSGSTGLPKGVAIEHHSTVNFIDWAMGVFTAEELSGVLASTSICFDLSVFELFVPLAAGGRVVLVENALGMQSLPPDAGVKLINTVPSAMTELLRLKSVSDSVMTVNLAGEPLATELVNAIYRQTRTTCVYDLYGPSETTTYSTFTRRSPGVPATIGRPLANTQVYVLDKHRQPVPPGVPGELYIAGDGLAREYLNRPELTDSKFVPNPFGRRAGDRMYRTADLTRWLPNGELEYLGRIDHQVKLRGFRIELGEIETALAQHPQVAQAVALLREDRPGDKRLVAYVVPGDPQSPPGAEGLRGSLGKKLPEYMVPSAFVVLDSLPLTPNGKLDRKALPAPEPSKSSLTADFVAPRDAIEKALAQTWAELLGVERVGVFDNFFLLGGHSLLAARLIASVHESFKTNLTLKTLIDSPTVAGVASAIKRDFGNVTCAVSEPAEHACGDLPTTAVRGTRGTLVARNTRNGALSLEPIDCRTYFEVQRSGSGGTPVVCIGDRRPVPFMLTRLPKTVPVVSLLLDGCQKTWPPRYFTVEEQIDVYAEALETSLDGRTVFLFGYSYGGLLAARLATLLRERGWTKVGLMMIEPEVPLCYRPLRAHVDFQVNRLRQFFGSLTERFRNGFRRAVQTPVPDWEPAPGDSAAHWNHMLAHYMQCTVTSKLFPSRERIALAGSEQYHAYSAACWSKIGLGGIDRCRFLNATDHYSCFREPHVSAWLDLFEESYGRAGAPTACLVEHRKAAA